MLKLRKILAVIYLLSFVCLVAALALYWFAIDPVASFMQDFRDDAMLDYMLWTLLGVTTIGTVGYVVRTLAQRGRNTFQKSSNELGVVQVSRAAIVKEVDNAIAAHPEVKHLKTNVSIKNRRHPYANVEVRVAPRGSLNMTEVVASIQRDIKDAVIRLTGNDVRKVTVDIRRSSDAGENMASAAEKQDAVRSEALGAGSSDHEVGDSTKASKRKRRRRSESSQEQDGEQVQEEAAQPDAVPAETVDEDVSAVEDASEQDAEPTEADDLQQLDIETEDAAEVDDASDSQE